MLVGAAGVAAGWAWADPVIGLLITVAILMVLRTAARDVFRRLMDGVDPDVVEQAEATLRAVEGVRVVRQFRIRWIGHAMHADASLDVDPSLSLTAAHELAHHAEAGLVRTVPRLTSVLVHAYPEHQT